MAKTQMEMQMHLKFYKTGWVKVKLLEKKYKG